LWGGDSRPAPQRAAPPFPKARAVAVGSRTVDRHSGRGPFDNPTADLIRGFSPRSRPCPRHEHRPQPQHATPAATRPVGMGRATIGWYYGANFGEGVCFTRHLVCCCPWRWRRNADERFRRGVRSSSACGGRGFGGGLRRCGSKCLASGAFHVTSGIPALARARVCGRLWTPPASQK